MKGKCRAGRQNLLCRLDQVQYLETLMLDVCATLEDLLQAGQTQSFLRSAWLLQNVNTHIHMRSKGIAYPVLYKLICMEGNENNTFLDKSTKDKDQEDLYMTLP